MHRRTIARSTIALAGGAVLGKNLCAQGGASQAIRRDILRVGPTRAMRTIAEAARVATPGTTIEVDAGDYRSDVAVWEHDDLTVRAVGGRVRLLAAGAAAEGKGIWVVRADRMQAEGFDFEGAAVPDRNGAGIRLDRGSLLVRDCRFLRNEMGLLTNHHPTCSLDVENCEFAYNQRPDGHNHNLYVGRIARLKVTGSYFHHAHIGHLLKSRAAQNHILYNRLTDEAQGTGSYELEFPNGGEAFVLGNLIAQSARTGNRRLISFGAEGYRWPRNALYLVHNTLVNPLAWGGEYLHMAPRANAMHAINNLLVGPGKLQSAGPGDFRGNYSANAGDFAQASRHDFRLKHDSPLVGLATDPGAIQGYSLRQEREYVHPRSTRALHDTAHNPGALQRLAQLPSN